MISGVNRDVSFWDSIAFHPEVAPFVFLDHPRSSLSVLIEDEKNVPFSSDHGGVLFVKTDHLGSVYEMHTMFTPEGWGREVALTGAASLHNIFKTALMVFTYEQEGHWRSCPPKGHRWKSSGDFVDHGLSKRLKLWYLTRDDWLSSPVGKKIRCR